MTAAEVLVCGGHELDDQLRPVGDPCGRTYRARGWRPTRDDAITQARAARWLIIPLDDGALAVTCPQCRRPDPAIAELDRTLPTSRTSTSATTQDGAP